MADADEKEGFVGRWSRRKKAEAGNAAAPDETPPPEADPTPEELAAREQAIVDSLPDIESLDGDSDFSVFLKEGVPEALRHQALRKLWRVNPLMAGLDGLNDYDEDFTVLNLGVEGLKTAYKVGKGYLSDEEETPPETARDAEVELTEEPVAAEEGEPQTAAQDTAAPTETPAEDEVPAQREAAAKTDPQVAGSPLDGVGSKKSARERRWGKSDA
jgi:hypothetical protein